MCYKFPRRRPLCSRLGSRLSIRISFLDESRARYWYNSGETEADSELFMSGDRFCGAGGTGSSATRPPRWFIVGGEELAKGNASLASVPSIRSRRCSIASIRAIAGSISLEKASRPIDCPSAIVESQGPSAGNCRSIRLPRAYWFLESLCQYIFLMFNEA